MQRGRIISFSCKLCNFHFYFCATTKCIFCKVQKSFFPFKITHLISNLKPSCVCNHLFLPDFLSFKHQDFPYVKARKCPSRQIKKKEKKKEFVWKGKRKQRKDVGDVSVARICESRPTYIVVSSSHCAQPGVSNLWILLLNWVGHECPVHLPRLPSLNFCHHEACHHCHHQIMIIFFFWFVRRMHLRFMIYYLLLVGFWGGDALDALKKWGTLKKNPQKGRKHLTEEEMIWPTKILFMVCYIVAYY